jgi:hypothetical protein
VQLPNATAIQSLLQEALAEREKAPEVEALTIEVRNGTTNNGWDWLAAERLNYAGYSTRLAISDRLDYAQTLLYDLTDTFDLGRVGELLTLMGLPPSAFISAPQESDVSYVLVLGSDYQPCFNPTGVTP